MIVTVMNDKFNACIRTINITWDDFVAMCLCPGCMDYKGNGAIVGGLCVWDTEISYSTRNRHKIFEHKNRRCINRQLVILDADNPQDDFLDRTQSYFAKLDAAWVYYTTFSATKDNPRYRICTYLDKPVSPQSYETIAKSIMYGIGFEEFDPVSSNANQIMYLAVMPIKINPESGEEEIFFRRDSFDGYPIDTNRLMDDITTVSCGKSPKKVLPSNISEKSQLSAGTSKLIDPRTKDSIVGTFTSLFSIEEVMERFLPDVYEKIGDRYRPIGSGSTPGGRIVENGQYYLTSHTKKDNAYGSLKNSYDLVLCNLQEITTPEQLEELKLKAHSKGKNCETAGQIMYEWAMSIPEVYEAEAKRINKRKKNFK